MSLHRDDLPQLSELLFLTDGGLETDLIFHHGLALPHAAAYVLLEDEDGTARLSRYFDDYMAVARELRTGFVLESATWRANSEWAGKVGTPAQALASLNRRAIEMLVDIVAKNGNLLLNLTQRPDGTLDDECIHICRSMARWIRVNGEGIYGTRPWRKAGEGPASKQGGAFKEAELEWTSKDFRFTAKGDTVYAFQMEWPEDGKARSRSLGAKCRKKVKSVKLLGAGARPPFKQTARGLDIRLPAKQTSEVAHCFRIELA